MAVVWLLVAVHRTTLDSSSMNCDFEETEAKQVTLAVTQMATEVLSPVSFPY